MEFAWAVAQLAHLEVLDLSNNKLWDVNSLQMLQGLKQLNLSGNSKLQAFEVQNIIMGNPGLTHIKIAGISMADLNWLPPVGPQGEYDLQELDISETGSFIDLGLIGQYMNLRVLKAAGNQLEFVWPIDQLAQLEILDLSNNDLQSVLMLGDLVNLTSLDLRGNNHIQCDELDDLEARLLPGVLLRPLSCIILTPPTVTILSPDATQTYFSTSSIDFVATAFDAEDGSLDELIQWSSSIDGPLGTGGVILKTLSLGTHILTATITDSAGGMHSGATEIVIDQIDLKVRVFSKGRINIAALKWSGSRTSVDIYKDDVVVGAGEANGTAIYRFKDTAVFKVCESATNYCSVEVVVP